MRGIVRNLSRRNAALDTQKRPEYLNVMLRGGRMTKVAGVAASFAPSLGVVGIALSTGVSSVALGAALTTTGAMAGSCVLSGGVYECSGPADPTTDVTVILSPPAPLQAVTTPGFGIDTSVSGGNAFTLGGNPATPSINFNDAY